MGTDQDFLTAIAAAPAGEQMALRCAYADWLEEQGRAYAAAMCRQEWLLLSVQAKDIGDVCFDTLTCQMSVYMGKGRFDSDLISSLT